MNSTLNASPARTDHEFGSNWKSDAVAEIDDESPSSSSPHAPSAIAHPMTTITPVVLRIAHLLFGTLS
jgi:hypothetical protein